MAPFNEWGSTASRLEPLRGGSLYLYTVPALLSPMTYVRITNRSMLILDVFSASSSFGLETNRTASSDIDLNKIKTLKALKEVFMFSSCRTEIH